jgi:hypothetical protein
MNQPVIAAVTGLVFGSILCVSAYTYRSHRSHHSCCQRRAISASAVVKAAPAVEQPRPTDCMQEDRALSIAQTSFVNGDFAESIRIANLCMPRSPVRAWRIIGAAACHLHDRDNVQQAYRHLDASGRQYLAYACERADFSVLSAR